MDKRHFYRTARLNWGLGNMRQFVGIKRWNPETDQYLCVMALGNLKWLDAKELTDFVL